MSEERYRPLASRLLIGRPKWKLLFDEIGKTNRQWVTSGVVQSNSVVAAAVTVCVCVAGSGWGCSAADLKASPGLCTDCVTRLEPRGRLLNSTRSPSADRTPVRARGTQTSGGDFGAKDLYLKSITEYQMTRVTWKCESISDSWDWLQK